MTDGSTGLSLFAYGSLQIDSVMEAVIGRRPTGGPAVLPGYRRRLLRARSYPGVVPETGASTDGVLFDGLALADLEILDLFEGDPYERRRVAVQTEGAVRRDVWVYVIRSGRIDLMTEKPWDLDGFRERSLPAFLVQCRAFRAEVLRGAAFGRPE